MIYAYCLSLFSIHFFGSHSLANFKLRLINQQTGDCTDSAILNAGKLSSHSFPVPIKLKGGEHLLVKVKLLSLPTNSAEVLVGEGVISFDKSSIDNTLRVPIYDKQRGIEEVAICSIDFFLSGFQVDKHTSINPDKSRSRFEDWRERSEDAVYSQMSYTLESERDSAYSSKDPKAPAPLLATTPAKGHNQTKSQSKPKEVRFQQQPNEFKNAGDKIDAKVLSPRNPIQSRIKDNQQEQKALAKKKMSNQLSFKPFTLENNIYLDQSPQKKTEISTLVKDKKLQRETKKLPPYSIRKKFALDSEEEHSRNQKNNQFSPEHLRETVKENQEVLSKLKKYISHIEKEQESPKHKRRRKKIKVEEFAAYSSQNNFIKYHTEIKPYPCKVMRNLRAVRIVENQIKQPSEERVIPQVINRVSINSPNSSKIVSFDASGFRSHCLSSGQSESVASILIPASQSALKVMVELGEEGDFEGMIGLQEGEQMAIRLTRLNGAKDQSLLERSQFKLLFDIKSADSKPSVKVPNIYHNHDISFRQPYDVLMSEQDIKTRVGQLSCQPWGFVQSYAEGVIISPQSKQLMNKIDQQLPRLKEQLHLTKLSNQKKIKKQASIKREPNIKKQEQEIKPRSISKQYLESSIKKVNPKPTSLRRETDSINSIRNGNRNNYRFKEGSPSKHIKEAWEQILFKRNVQEERRKQEAHKKMKNPGKANYPNHSTSRKLLDERRILNESNTESGSESLTSSKSKANKIYEFRQNQKIPAYPVRTFTLKISNLSITQPQALIDLNNELPVGKFVKFSIKGRVIYFTEVIFSGNYNSILWKLDGCLFEELNGTEKLRIEIYETLNNRITILGISEIRVNRLYFLRGNHIYNGTIINQSTLFGEFTLGFEIQQLYPFQVIHEEDEDTINLVKHSSHNLSKNKRLRTVSHLSEKRMKNPLKGQNYKLNPANEEYASEESMQRNQLEQSMSMPMGLGKQ